VGVFDGIAICDCVTKAVAAPPPPFPVRNPQSATRNPPLIVLSPSTSAVTTATLLLRQISGPDDKHIYEGEKETDGKVQFSVKTPGRYQCVPLFDIASLDCHIPASSHYSNNIIMATILPATSSPQHSYAADTTPTAAFCPLLTSQHGLQLLFRQ